MHIGAPPAFRPDRPWTLILCVPTWHLTRLHLRGTASTVPILAMASVVSNQALERAFADKSFRLDATLVPRIQALAQQWHLSADVLAGQYESLALVK